MQGVEAFKTCEVDKYKLNTTFGPLLNVKKYDSGGIKIKQQTIIQSSLNRAPMARFIYAQKLIN